MLKRNNKLRHLHYFEERFLNELIEKIRVSYPLIKKIILYGSKARGDFTEESDIDLLFITKKPLNKQEKYEIFDFISELELKYNVLASALFINEKELKERSLFREIKKDGITLWLRE
ncbi:nucleotidyltransferase domain-containing protein [Thermodesulfovibrio yellowstonii]|uniref:nucleotidyltransferase domain-containing protein n=1 Tax=Thermodesulfovibrio yellowstonii TaxID=28262 RepID=UPI0006890B14|nr:nucleotidyltransferase domain-containing protein [Thermodesulfovibrio islandicus]